MPMVAFVTIWWTNGFNVLLFIAGLLWTMAYDTMYAMVDREDDRNYPR